MIIPNVVGIILLSGQVVDMERHYRDVHLIKA